MKLIEPDLIIYGFDISQYALEKIWIQLNRTYIAKKRKININIKIKKLT